MTNEIKNEALNNDYEPTIHSDPFELIKYNLVKQTEANIISDIYDNTSFTIIDQNDYKKDNSSVISEHVEMIKKIYDEIDNENIDELLVNYDMLTVMYSASSILVNSQIVWDDVSENYRRKVILHLNDRKIKVCPVNSPDNFITFIKGISLDTYKTVVIYNGEQCIKVPKDLKFKGYKFENVMFY